MLFRSTGGGLRLGLGRRAADPAVALDDQGDQRAIAVARPDAEWKVEWERERPYEWGGGDGEGSEAQGVDPGRGRVVGRVNARCCDLDLHKRCTTV